MILEKSLKSLTVTVRGGGKLISHRPVFSQDGRTLYIVQSSSILAFSTSTCLLITRYTTPNAVPIANIQPLSDSSLLVFTTTGHLFTLNTTTGRFVLEVEITVPSGWTPMSNFINFKFPSSLENNPYEHFLTLGYPQDTSLPILYSISIRNGAPGQMCWAVLPGQHSFDMSKDGRFIVAIQETSLYCKDMEDPLNCKWHSSGTRKFTCVAVHPSESFVCATGDDSGRILIWNNVMTQKSPSKTVFHWHTLPVVDLIFSVEGSQMFSGGGECTLVKWDCSDTTNKRTLPRMGLPIRHLSCGDELVAVSHADNCVHLVDQYNKIVGVIKNFTNAYIPDEDEGGVKSDLFPTGIVIDPSNNCLVINSRPGWLQAYDFRLDKHVYSLDVCQQNYVTAERDRIIPNADVIKVAFSKTGVWMATVDGRKYEKNYGELKLKFWKRNKESGKFVLSTVVDWPHEGNVSSLEFRPIGEQGDFVALSSGDKRVKVWGLAERSSVHGDTEYWYLGNVLEYKDLPAGPISFGSDASLVAVAFGRIVTLWDMEDLRIRLSLCHTRLKDPVRMMQFGYKMQSHLVLCASTDSLYVWDVITASLLWVVPVKVNCFSVDASSGLCAAATFDHSIVVFEMNSADPLVVHERVTKSGVITCQWVEDKGKQLKSSLVFINNSQELCALSEKRDDERQETVKIDQDVHMTVYSEMVAETVVTEVESGKGLGQRSTGQKAHALLREIMDSSPHTMPSMSYYCSQLMRSMGSPVKEDDRLKKMEEIMKKKKKKAGKKTAQDENDDSKVSNTTTDVTNADKNNILMSGRPREIEKLIEKLNLDEVIEDDCAWIESIFKNKIKT